MSTGVLAYLLIVSAFCTTIFVVSFPLLINAEQNTSTRIYIAGISTALVTSLLTFLFISVKTESFFFEDQNSYLKIYPVITGILVPLAIYLQPLFLRSTRKKISRLVWLILAVLIIHRLGQVWYFWDPKLAEIFFTSHPNLTILKPSLEFIVPAIWLAYESTKILTKTDHLIVQIIKQLSILGSIVGIILMLLIFYKVNLLSENLSKVYIQDQILQFRIFRGSWYCLFQIFTCFYWVSLYSKQAVTQRENQQKVANLLVEKDELIRNLSNKNILIEAGGLSAGLAHELNQYLARIEINSGEVIEYLKHPQMSAKELETALKNIRYANRSAANLVISLKKLFQSGSGDFVQVEVDRLVHEVISLYQDRVSKSKIQMVVSLNSGMIIPVWDVLIRQAVANLMANAIEALDSTEQSNKQIQIESQSTADGHYLLSITDNGPGIDPEKIQHLFNLFFSSKSSGSGIGLWLTNYIIERHQGKLHFVNLPNQTGVQFTLMIPMSRDKVA